MRLVLFVTNPVATRRLTGEKGADDVLLSEITGVDVARGRTDSHVEEGVDTTTLSVSLQGVARTVGS